jgi:hypothetical protein
MTDQTGSVAHAHGHFRPESLSHFKEVARNVAWLLERPLQKCQEDLARIYGYFGLHELQQVLKQPGTPGPFAPRYNYLASDDEALVEGHDRRIFFVLFGVPKGYWREDHLAKDRCFLVFEMGLFQEAAEHRACFEKIRQVLSYEVEPDRWPLIHGWPLGLKSWLASGYTEPADLAKGWHEVLPRSRYFPMRHADIRWQRRMTGLVRLQTMFQILASRVGGRKPTGMGRVAFDQFEDDGGGISEPSWETYHLVEWLTEKLTQESGPEFHQQQELLQAFVQRPSRATAAACEFVKDLKDPVDFRDRWAFESFKAALDGSVDGSRCLFSSSLDEGAIQSMFLHMDWDSAEISESNGCRLWQFNYTRTEVAESGIAGGRPTLQPVIHANGTLIVPVDAELAVMSSSNWFLCHDDSEFASSAAALAFAELYLPAIGVKRVDFMYRDYNYSIIEIDELLLAPSMGVEALESYFARLLLAFDEDCLPDSYGLWCKTLSLSYEDEDENDKRNQDGEYADYVYPPSVLLINVQGCGLTFVEATHQNGKPVSTLKRDASKNPTPSGEALATMVMEAVKGLSVDVVVYDGVLN